MIKAIHLALALLLTFNCICRHEADNIQEIFNSMANSPLKDQFKAFYFHYERPYDLNSEEGLIRYRIFKSNVKFIKERNAMNLGYTLGVNQFADLTLEEYKNTYLNKNIVHQDAVINNNLSNTINDDDDDFLFDDNSYPNWESYMPPARNQKACGSCWAFSILGALEGSYSIKYGKKLNLSRQDMVDCDLSNDGCDGGVSEWGLDYVLKNGVTYENLYQYVSGFTGERGSCKTNIQRLKILKSYKGTSGGTAEFNSLLAKGPLKVNMDAGSQEFVYYQGGVIDLPCTNINHGVVAIGRGIEDGKEYIYVRNSHGKNWGIRGNIKIKVNNWNSTCFVEKTPYLLEVGEVTFPEPPEPEKGCLLVSNKCGGKGEIFESCSSKSSVPFMNFSGVFSAKFNKFEGRKITFFSGNDCEGSYTEADDDASCIKMNLGSFIIHEEANPPSKCIWIYEDSCFGGNKYEICDKNTNLKANGYTLGSFKLGSQVVGVKLISGYSSVTLKSSTYKIFSVFFKKTDSVELQF